MRCLTCCMEMVKVDKGWVCTNPLCPEEGFRDNHKDSGELK